MTQSSLEAYHNEDNRKRRLTHKEQIKKFYEINNDLKLTVREISFWTKLTFNQANKRVSDLKNEGYLIVCGKVMEEGNNNSLYMINKAPLIFDNKKKSNLELLKLAVRKYTTQEMEDTIFEEFERLKNYQK